MIDDFESKYADMVSDRIPATWPGEHPCLEDMQLRFGVELLYHLSRIADALESIRTASWSR